MTTSQPILERTVILEPGSSWLKINTANEATPKRLPHCIARRLKPSGQIPRRYGVLNGGKLIPDSERLSSVPSYIDGSATKSVADKMGVNLSTVVWEPINSSTDNLVNEKIQSTEQPFLSFDQALSVAENANFQISWPFDRRFLREDVNYSSLLQDLQDLWSTALHSYLSIDIGDLPSYRVILIIGDVFRHNEVRYLIDLLVSKLHFGHALVHQGSVCATYSLGLPAACVLNIGDEATSISCVDDGLSNVDSRVLLPVGRSTVLRVFHGLVSPHGFKSDLEKFTDFDHYSTHDVEDLRLWLQYFEQTASPLLLGSTKSDAENVAPIEKTSAKVDTSIFWQRANRMAKNVSLPISIAYYANLLPFARIPWAANPYKAAQRFYELQLSLLDDPQPDDPFDDLYMNLTSRDRRKRNPGQTTIATAPGTVDTTNELCAGEPNVTDGDQPLNYLPSVPQSCEVSGHFDSLPDAIWWSINRCTLSNRESASEAIPVIGNPSAAEELRKRLLKCIVLVGGGAAPALASQLMRSWLTQALSDLVAKTTDSPLYPVEIVTHQSAADLVWIGARLLLTTESINDLWISPAEWTKLGSALLREKAPFIW